MPTLTCNFTEFIYVKYASPEGCAKIEIHQSMRLIKGRTDIETMKLDGSQRATNSTEWKLITPKGFDTWEIKYIGDFGDVLTLRPIIDELGVNKKPLHGRYIASLVSSTTTSISILVGICFVD